MKLDNTLLTMHKTPQGMIRDNFGSEYKGHTLTNGTRVSPEEMFTIHATYETLLLQGDFEEVLRMESEHGYPRTWLNSSLNNVERYNGNSNLGLREKLAEAEKQLSIKSKKERK